MSRYAFALVAAAAVFLAAWMLRYDVTGGSDTATYVTDRWTGKVWFCIHSTCDLVDRSETK